MLPRFVASLHFRHANYQFRYSTTIPPERIVITTGSSAGFLLSFLAAFSPGDVVAVASSGYPCYRNVCGALGMDVVTVPINSNYKVTSTELTKCIETRRSNGDKPVNGLIMSSPSNPTGAMLTKDELTTLVATCKR